MFSRRIITASSSLKFVRFQSSQAYKDTVALLKTDLKKSMLAKDTVKRDTVKGLISGIKNKEIDTKPDQHNEFLLYELFNKSISQRKDSVIEYEKLSRPESAAKEQKEINIIQEYLKQLPVASQEEIETKVGEFLTEAQKDGPLKLNQIFAKLDWNVVKNEWKASESTVRSAIAKQYRQQSKK